MGILCLYTFIVACKFDAVGFIFLYVCYICVQLSLLSTCLLLFGIDLLG
jgi:hypothetical protein